MIYKLVDRVYKERRAKDQRLDKPPFQMLLEVAPGGESRTGLAIVQTERGPQWHRANYFSPWSRHATKRRWEVSYFTIDDRKPTGDDCSLRGWLSRELGEGALCGWLLAEGERFLMDAEVDSLARELERLAGLPDSGPHERYMPEGTWSDYAGRRYSYIEMHWRPVAQVEEVTA